MVLPDTEKAGFQVCQRWGILVTEECVCVILVRCILLLLLPPLSLPQEISVCFLLSKKPRTFSCTFNAIHLLLNNQILCSGANQGCSQTHKTDFPILWELGLTNLINANEGNNQHKGFFCLGLVCFIFCLFLIWCYLLLPISFTL